MALAIDASTPAKFTSANALAITSASFTPPSGALLLLLFACNSNTAGMDTSISSVTNTGVSLSTAWARLARKNKNASSIGGAGAEGGAEIWGAVTSSSVASTVTVNGVGSGSGFDKFGKVMVLTGADAASLANVAAATSTSGLPSVVVASCAAGSYVFAVSSDWAQAGLGTAGTAQTIIDEYNLAGQLTTHAWRTTSVLGGAGSQTMNLTAPTAENYNLVGIEVKDASAVTATRIPMVISQSMGIF